VYTLLEPNALSAHRVYQPGVQDALEAVVDDDRSLPLFEEAEKKFQETAAHGAYGFRPPNSSSLLCPVW